MGIRCQPCPVTVVTHDGVRFPCEQARSAPPMYTPRFTYGEDAFQALMVSDDGAVQASKPLVITRGVVVVVGGGSGALGGRHAAAASATPATTTAKRSLGASITCPSRSRRTCRRSAPR